MGRVVVSKAKIHHQSCKALRHHQTYQGLFCRYGHEWVTFATQSRCNKEGTSGESGRLLSKAISLTRGVRSPGTPRGLRKSHSPPPRQDYLSSGTPKPPPPRTPKGPALMAEWSKESVLTASCLLRLMAEWSKVLPLTACCLSPLRACPDG